MADLDKITVSVESHLRRLLDARQYPKTICPSEVARALSHAELAEAGVATWRELMPALRKHAFNLRDEAEVEILQKGEVLPRTQTMEVTTGPIRIRKAR